MCDEHKGNCGAVSCDSCFDEIIEEVMNDPVTQWINSHQDEMVTTLAGKHVAFNARTGEPAFFARTFDEVHDLFTHAIEEEGFTDEVIFDAVPCPHNDTFVSGRCVFSCCEMRKCKWCDEEWRDSPTQCVGLIEHNQVKAEFASVSAQILLDAWQNWTCSAIHTRPGLARALLAAEKLELIDLTNVTPHPKNFIK